MAAIPEILYESKKTIGITGYRLTFASDNLSIVSCTVIFSIFDEVHTRTMRCVDVRNDRAFHGDFYNQPSSCFNKLYPASVNVFGSDQSLHPVACINSYIQCGDLQYFFTTKPNPVLENIRAGDMDPTPSIVFVPVEGAYPACIDAAVLKNKCDEDEEEEQEEEEETVSYSSYTSYVSPDQKFFIRSVDSLFEANTTFSLIVLHPECGGTAKRFEVYRTDKNIGETDCYLWFCESTGSHVRLSRPEVVKNMATIVSYDCEDGYTKYYLKCLPKWE